MDDEWGFKEIEEIGGVWPLREGSYDVSYMVAGYFYTRTVYAQDELDAVIKLRKWRAERWEQLTGHGKY